MKRFDERTLEGLILWYRKNKRDFPWRADPDPYKVWVAEIMSQQTQMSALMPYYEKFMRRFPGVRALAAAEEPAVLKEWTGLGYYSRAKNLRKAARRIVEDFNGEFPGSYEQWLELDGVGPYTAAAVVSQSFNGKRAVWDGNVLRVASRFFGEREPFAAAFRAAVIAAIEDGMRHLPASELNQAFMELGALVCSPKKPRCGSCPLVESCAARKSGQEDHLPPPKPRKKEILVEAKVFVQVRRSREGLFTLLRERRKGHWFSGMWDFPSELGGVEKPVQRDGLSALKGDAVVLKPVLHSITHHKIKLTPHVFLVTSGSETRLEEGERWVAVADAFHEAAAYPVATTARKVMRAVGRWLESERGLYV